MNTKRRLPIGIRTFREIREGGCCYIDKTAHIGRLLRLYEGEGLRGQVPAPGQPIHLIGVEFSREARNVAAFEVERAA